MGLTPAPVADEGMVLSAAEDLYRDELTPGVEFSGATYARVWLEAVTAAAASRDAGEHADGDGTGSGVRFLPRSRWGSVLSSTVPACAWAALARRHTVAARPGEPESFLLTPSGLVRCLVNVVVPPDRVSCYVKTAVGVSHAAGGHVAPHGMSARAGEIFAVLRNDGVSIAEAAAAAEALS